MAILTRLTRLLKADLHALLDRMEAPDVLLQQSLRDMDAELQQARQYQQQLHQQCQQMGRLQSSLQQQQQQQQDELDLCLAESNDTLARVLLRRTLETRQQLQLLQTRLQDIQTRIEQGDEECRQQQAAFSALQAQAEYWLAPTKAPQQTPTNSPLQTPLHPPLITDADIEVALLKAKRERSAS